jgi:hypothetical protein
MPNSRAQADCMPLQKDAHPAYGGAERLKLKRLDAKSR